MPSDRRPGPADWVAAPHDSSSQAATAASELAGLNEFLIGYSAARWSARARGAQPHRETGELSSTSVRAIVPARVRTSIAVDLRRQRHPRAAAAPGRDRRQQRLIPDT